MKVKKSKKNMKFTTIAWIMAAALLAIIIPINIAVSFTDIKADLTGDNLYSLTDTTREYLETIDETIDFYLLADMKEVEADGKLMALVNIINEYKSYDCINFVDVDPDLHPEIKDELNPSGYMQLSAGDMIIRCNGNTKRIPGNTMYSNVYDDDGNLTAESFNGENAITGAIKSVVEGIMPSVYFLTGHGEKTLENDYSTFRKNLENYNYKAKELNLMTADAVPEDAAIIIVAAPKTDIDLSEKAKLNSFLEKGGNLSLLMSPNESDIDYTNIEDIMHGHGLAMDYNIVTESASDNHIAGDNTQITFNLVDVSELEDENITDLTSSLIDASSLIPYMPASRSFYQYNAHENHSELTICPLIETYETAVGKPYGGTAVDPDEIAGKLYLGAYSENRLDKSKVVVMGNGEFIDDEYIQSDYTIVPVYLYLSTISWMYDSDVDMNISPKTDMNDYMVLENKSDTNAMMIILNVAPVVVALSGIFIWLKRRHA